MFAMAGAGFAHNLLVMNVAIALHQALRGRGCRVVSNDMRVRVSETGLYTYPDIVALCKKPELADDHFDVLLNPELVGEVLSPSTAAYDLGRKFEHYRTIPSLTGYLVIASDRVHVSLYTRQNGTWSLTDANGRDGILELPALGCRLSLSDIYENVDLPESALH
ncbi:MAG: Uma2 family endonuclease [Acidobacteriota bacterium]|nr:Uma2 family endonuclease [Acidobacteriota bacterium]